MCDLWRPSGPDKPYLFEMPAGVSWARYLRMMGASVLAMFAGAQVVHQYYLPDLVSCNFPTPSPLPAGIDTTALYVFSEYPRGSAQTRRAADRAERLQTQGGGHCCCRTAAGVSAENGIIELYYYHPPPPIVCLY